MEYLIGSYSETNYATTTPLRAGVNRLMGNTFLCSQDLILTKAKFYISSTGSPTGNVYAYLYATSGTFGVNENTTGQPLATSEPIPIESILSSVALVEFTFTDEVALNSGTAYSIICGFNGGDASNRLNFGYDSSSPTNAGIMSYSSNGTSWTRGASYDAIFYVYGEEAEVVVTPDPTKIDNIEKSGYQNIFDEATLPFREDRPFYFPNFTRINNIEL